MPQRAAWIGAGVVLVSMAAWAARPPQTEDVPVTREFARFDSDGNGYVSRVEAGPLLRARFERADRNGDGLLDASEFARMVASGTRR